MSFCATLTLNAHLFYLSVGSLDNTELSGKKIPSVCLVWEKKDALEGGLAQALALQKGRNVDYHAACRGEGQQSSTHSEMCLFHAPYLGKSYRMGRWLGRGTKRS